MCRNKAGKARKRCNDKDSLYDRRIELLCGSSRDAISFHLPFPDHMHRFDARQDDAGTTKILESQHRPGTALDRPVVLFDEVIQILVLADLDRRVALGIEGLQRSQIGAAFVDRYRLGFCWCSQLPLAVSMGVDKKWGKGAHCRATSGDLK